MDMYLEIFHVIFTKATKNPAKLSLKKGLMELVMVAHAYNYSTREANLKVTLPGVQGQPGLQGETLKKMPKKQKYK